MVRQIFRNLVFCLAGPMDGEYTNGNMTSWCEMRKGVFVTEYSDVVTHLLCTKEQFTKKTGPIKRALKKKSVAILDIAWFNECTATEKKPDKRQHDMRNILRQEKIERQKIRLKQRQERELQTWVPSSTFRILKDEEYFPYNIELTRYVEDTGYTEKYLLCLFQSIAKNPHTYRFAAKFWKKRGATPNIYRQETPDFGVSLDRAWRAFLGFFKVKTGIDWSDRVLKMSTMGKEFFQYCPPTRGKPVGVGLGLPYEECLKRNAELRGIPWPHVEAGGRNEVRSENETNDAINEATHRSSEDQIHEQVSVGDPEQSEPVEEK